MRTLPTAYVLEAMALRLETRSGTVALKMADGFLIRAERERAFPSPFPPSTEALRDYFGPTFVAKGAVFQSELDPDNTGKRLSPVFVIERLEAGALLWPLPPLPEEISRKPMHVRHSAR